MAGISVFNYGKIELCSNKGLIYDCGSYSGTYMGGISVFNYNLIRKCYNAGEFESNSSTNGGIVGRNNEGTVEECYNTGLVKDNEYGNSAGIVGDNHYGTIKNCYNSNRDMGGNGLIVSFGIVGEHLGNVSLVSNCYSIYNNNICGTLNGWSPIQNVRFNKCYSLTNTTAEYMKSLEFVNILGTNIWKQDTNNINNGYPILKWQE